MLNIVLIHSTQMVSEFQHYSKWKRASRVARPSMSFVRRDVAPQRLHSCQTAARFALNSIAGTEIRRAFEIRFESSSSSPTHSPINFFSTIGRHPRWHVPNKNQLPSYPETREVSHRCQGKTSRVFAHEWQRIVTRFASQWSVFVRIVLTKTVRKGNQINKS